MAENLQWYELPAKRWQERDGEGCRIWRDSQRQKMYNAENCLKRHCRDEGEHGRVDENAEFESIKEIEHYVNKLLKSAWFIRRWGKKENPIIVEIQGHTAWGNRMRNKMALPKWAWNKVVVLHELSHVLHAYDCGTVHGRYFCRTLLELIDHELSPESRRFLKKRFIATGVRSTPHPAYSEDTKIKKREHGRKLANKYGMATSSKDCEWNDMLAAAFGGS